MNRTPLNITNLIRSAPPTDHGRTQVIRTFMVDDSPFMLVLLARLLAKDKRITLVGSVSDGPRAFQSASMSRPDLVLMDLHMAAADGAEITRWLKQLQKPPIVFVVTSDDSPHARARSLAAGADAFLVKAEDLAVELPGAIEKFFGDGLQAKNRNVGERHDPIASNK